MDPKFLPLRHFRPSLPRAGTDSTTEDDCRRRSHPRQRYIRDSDGLSTTLRKWRCSRRKLSVLTANVLCLG